MQPLPEPNDVAGSLAVLSHQLNALSHRLQKLEPQEFNCHAVSSFEFPRKIQQKTRKSRRVSVLRLSLMVLAFALMGLMTPTINDDDGPIDANVVYALPAPFLKGFDEVVTGLDLDLHAHLHADETAANAAVTVVHGTAAAERVLVRRIVDAVANVVKRASRDDFISVVASVFVFAFNRMTCTLRGAA